ncbi:3-oxo-5-alpha-steroid 4-dehydrogenase-domain-containing protein [Coemansia spiralis]|nr:3-oxo-5-alpha-steroid 4-dehydrogenase-domain-containing protein [Coemansia spiralis]
MNVQSYLEVTTEQELFDVALRGFLLTSVLVLGGLLVFGSPYGSQTNYNGIFTISGRAAWIFMELVSPVVFIYSYFSSNLAFLLPSKIQPLERSASTRSLVFVALWIAHYVNRAIIYPLRQPSRKNMHIGIMLCAVVFNTVNAYLNGRWLATAFSSHATEPFNSWDILIPYGSLFSFVSCPHFFCELAEWAGFALASGSPAAWAFVLNILCNLAPRAYFIHRWYIGTFAVYPKSRKAIIPFVF